MMPFKTNTWDSYKVLFVVVDVFVDYEQVHETDSSLIKIFFMFLLGQEANAAQTCIETVAASEVDRQFATCC